MKRVLVISYYFPPSGGPGVQRMLKFVKYLPDFGWQPTVLTVRADHASYPDLDATLEAEIPASVEVVKTRSWDPYALYARLQGKSRTEAVGVGFVKDEAEGWMQRLAKWMRANLFLPDARVGWVPFALHAAKRMMEQEPFDVVITSGPPHSTHLVGRALKRRFGCRWVVDMRDPWTDISYYKELPHTPPALRMDAALERSVLSRADAVISVSEGVGDLLKAKAPLHQYETLPNGYDPADIEYLIVSHGHGDHVGGASHIQEQYGARVVMSEADWELVERSQASWPKPTRDIVAEDGDVIHLGDVTVQLFLTPGHTPGTLSTVVGPIRDGDEEYTAAAWGGTAFNFRGTAQFPRDHWLRLYGESAARFSEVVDGVGAEILIANHPRFDQTPLKVPALASRRTGEPHPYVIGTDRVRGYLGVAEHCAAAARIAEAR